jgi:hypothetical protein
MDPTPPSSNLLKGLHLHQKLERFYATGSDVPLAYCASDVDYTALEVRLWASLRGELGVVAVEVDYDGVPVPFAPYKHFDSKGVRALAKLSGFQSFYGGLAEYGTPLMDPPYGIRVLGTTTGRMSCSRPEPQRLPGRGVRK